MFDRYVLGRYSVEYVPYTKTVIEKRAPTDDSIRLYEEIKEKAYNSILDSCTIETNTLHSKCLVYRDVYSFSTKLKYSFNLNGKEYANTISIKEDLVGDRREYLNIIYKELTKLIALDLTRELV